MDDVERWLVEKEKEKETGSQQQTHQSHAGSDVSQDISDIREEMTELQGRMSEIGREMAKLATSPHPEQYTCEGPSSPQGCVLGFRGRSPLDDCLSYTFIPDG
jgi:hypothetical protein